MYRSSLPFIFIWLVSFVLAIGISKLVIRSQYLLYKSPMIKLIHGRWKIEEIHFETEIYDRLNFYQELIINKDHLVFNENGTGQISDLYYFNWWVHPWENQILLNSRRDNPIYNFDGWYDIEVDWWGNEKDRQLSICGADSKSVVTKGRNQNQWHARSCFYPQDPPIKKWIEKFLF